MTKLAIKKIIISAIIILSTICGALISTSVFNSVAAIDSTSSSSAVASSSNTTPITAGSYEGLAIYDIGDLVQFRDNVNNGMPYEENGTKYTVTLMADISYKIIGSWTPIGYNNDANNKVLRSFQGIFEGNGYIISHFNINIGDFNAVEQMTENNVECRYLGVGLFGYIENNARIQNLMLKDVTVNVSDDHQVPLGVGTLVGWMNNSTISNCMIVDETITLTDGDHANDWADPVYDSNLSGFVGVSEGKCTISNCGVQNATINGVFPSQIGSSNDVLSLFVGGLVGLNFYSSKLDVRGSYFQGIITLSNTGGSQVRRCLSVGGIVGCQKMNSDATTESTVNIESSFSAASVDYSNITLMLPDSIAALGRYVYESTNYLFGGTWHDSLAPDDNPFDGVDPRPDVARYFNHHGFTYSNCVAVRYSNNALSEFFYSYIYASGFEGNYLRQLRFSPLYDDIDHNNEYAFKRIDGEDELYHTYAGNVDKVIPAIYTNLGWISDNLIDYDEYYYINDRVNNYSSVWLLPINQNIANGLPILKRFCVNVNFVTNDSSLGTIEHPRGFEFFSDIYILPRYITEDFSKNSESLLRTFTDYAVAQPASFAEFQYWDWGSGTYLPKAAELKDSISITSHFKVLDEIPKDDVRVMILDNEFDSNNDVSDSSVSGFDYCYYRYGETSARLNYEDFTITYTIEVHTDLEVMKNLFNQNLNDFVLRLSDAMDTYLSFNYFIQDNDGIQSINIVETQSGLTVARVQIGECTVTPDSGYGRYKVTGVSWMYSPLNQRGTGEYYHDELQAAPLPPGSVPYALNSAEQPWVYLEPVFEFEENPLEVQFHFNGVSGNEDAKGEIRTNPIEIPLQVDQNVVLYPIYDDEEPYNMIGFGVQINGLPYETATIIYPPWEENRPVKWAYSIDDAEPIKEDNYTSIGIPYEFVYNADVIHVYITPDYEQFTLNMWVDIYGLSGLDDEKSVKFQYNSGDIDLTDSEPDDIVSVGGNLKYFGDWIIGFDGASILDYNGNAINGMSYSYDANSGILDIYYAIPGKTYPEWVQDKWYDGHWSFTVSDIFTALNGNTYYVVTELLSGSWGDMPAKFITAYWSNTYTLHIENDGTEGLGSSIWNNLSNPTNYYGVGGSGSNINVDSNLTELDMTIRHSSTYAYPFMTSEYKNRGLSMRTRDDFERLSATNLPNCNRNYYYIFNYGYRINGYYISFIYNNRTYYLTYQGGAWGCSSSRTPVYISNLSNDDLADMSLYAERLDELNAGGVPSNTTITMIPIWQAVNIQLTSSNRIWQGKFNTNYNTTSYVNTSLGTTLGYFTAGASGVYIMPSTGNIPYNYYNVPYNLYSNYNRNYSTYTLSISPHQVNNIYRVDLTGYKDKDNYYTLTGDTDYSFVSPTLSTYLITYQDEDGYETYSRAKYRFANDYASYIYDVITDYESDISNGRHDALRKVFVNGGAVTNERSINSSGVTGMYIYLANNCPTGDLPIFDSTYEILIYWANTETSSNGSRYAYTTSAYNQHDHGIPQYAENSYYVTHNQPIWQLTDGYQSISQGSLQIAKVTFEAFYFRKVYYMDVSTAFDNTNNVNQYGYVRIDVNDATEALNTVDDKSADYLVIYLNDGMKYYDVTGMSFSSIADINFNRLTELDELPVYAGCDVTITAYDQSKDSRAMLTGYYFDQIGYKYNEIASNRDVFDSTAYSHSATAEEIDSENMDTGDHINVTVYFDYVNYNLSIRMETGDRTEGTFVVTHPNGAVSGSLTTASLTGLNVNNTVQITYRALSGYEFDDVAFSLLLNGREIELLSYNELKSAGSQTYVLTLDADWLYNIYYINFDTTFSIENTNLGTIQLNTDEIEFDYYVKLINGETNEELENRLLDTWQISDGTVSLANAFTNNGDMGYVIRINGEYYAATYSYAYLPRNPSNMTNHYQSYNFLLTELPTREYSISTDLLSYMTLSTIYEILDEDLRDIYMVVVVRKIVTIQFEVSEVTHDPDGERVVTITNGNSNSKQITVSSNYNTIGTIYSYVGQQNTISLTYNQNMYEGATYTYNDLQIDSSFVATVDGTIIIEFIPKPLNVRVEYYVNDSLQSDISDKLDIEFNHANEVYYCTESNHTDGQIQIIFTQKTQDYDLYIYINDVNQISSYNINTPTVINYKVTRSDVELGEIYIKVVEVEHNNEEITIEFALVDSKLSMPSDNFGSYTVIINDVAVEQADSYRVYEGRKLQIQIDLNTGYAYYGVMHNNGLITYPELSDDNIITITTSFTENDGGRYRIYLNKTRINAELRMVGDTHRIYTMDANQSEGDGIVKTTSQDGSVVRLSNLYVGKIITFTRLQDDKYQQLNYYYYVITTSNETIYQTIEGNTLAITSSLLNNIEGDLIIYVNTTNKYMVDLQVIEGRDYANIDYEQFYTNGDYIYFTEGTVIPFIITTIEEGRYDIVVTGDLQLTGDDINEKFTITKDMTIRVSITPKVYNTDDVTEYVFMEISDLENNDPQLVGEEDRNPIMSSNQTYNQEAYVRIDMNLSDRVLYIVKFTCEDIEFTLNLETNEMTANGEFTYENNVLTINGRTYRISITDNLLEISYTSHGDIQLELTYKSVKLIYPAGSND